MDTFAEYDFQVRSYECGADGYASLPTVCNYLQEAASRHAEALGFSKSNFVAAGENISWVLTRMRVKMARYPRWEETVTVGTFPRTGRQITAYRDFSLRIGGETIGGATSEWMVIDLATRKVARVPESVFQKTNDVREPVLGADAFLKLRWQEGRALAGERQFRARRGEVDLNGHINNVHYVEWLMETLPESAGCIRDFAITFKSETLAGETVRASSCETAPGVWAAQVASSDKREHALAEFRV